MPWATGVRPPHRLVFCLAGPRPRSNSLQRLDRQQAALVARHQRLAPVCLAVVVGLQAALEEAPLAVLRQCQLLAAARAAYLARQLPVAVLLAALVALAVPAAQQRLLLAALVLLPLLLGHPRCCLELQLAGLVAAGVGLAVAVAATIGSLVASLRAAMAAAVGSHQWLSAFHPWRRQQHQQHQQQ